MRSPSQLHNTDMDRTGAFAPAAHVPVVQAQGANSKPHQLDRFILNNPFDRVAHAR